MEQPQITPARLAVVAIGLVAVYEEWKGVREETLWNFDFASVVMALLYLITVVGVIITIRRLIKREKAYASPTMLLAIVFILMVWGHRGVVYEKDARLDKYTAYTEEIGGDGGLYLSFKEDGYLTAQKQDQWQVTWYRGSYTQRGDSLLLSMPAEFQVGNIAVIEGEALRFLDTKISFQFYRK